MASGKSLANKMNRTASSDWVTYNTSEVKQKIIAMRRNKPFTNINEDSKVL